jgi:cell division protein FtsB
MATRRPKVPRVTPPAHQSSAGTAGGDVIQADFGGPRAATGTHEAGAGSGHGGTGAKASGGANDAGPRRALVPTLALVPRPARVPSLGRVPRAQRLKLPLAPKQARVPSPGAGTKAGGGKPGGAGNSRGKSGSPAAAEEENLDPVPAKAFSGRMLALAVVMVAITIMLAPTVKIFIDKRAEIAALESDIADSKANQDNLKRQVSRWQDPNYVKQQARDRINMVMPGETGYWVFGSDLPAGASGSQPSAAETQDPADVPWVDSLWESIRRSATD